MIIADIKGVRPDFDKMPHVIDRRYGIGNRQLFQQGSSTQTCETDAEVLDSTLAELGIPPLHIVRMFDEEENEYYVEMTGDLARVMPNIFGDKEE